MSPHSPGSGSGDESGKWTIRPGAKKSKVAGKGAGGSTRAHRPVYIEVLVSLHRIESSVGDEAYSDRSARYAALQSMGRAARDEVLTWLRDQGYKSGYKHVSQVTVFGTFTVECTSEVMAALRRAPGVFSVTRVSDVPLELID